MSDLTSLEELSLSGGENAVSDLGILARMASLRGLGLGGNDVSDLSALAAMHDLFWLNLRDNDVSDIEAITELEDIYWLDVTGNPLDPNAVLVHLPAMRDRGVHVNY